MNDIKVLFKKTHKDSKIPKYSHIGDSGADLYSIEGFELKPFGVYSVQVGINIKLDNGVGYLITSNLVLAKHNVFVVADHVSVCGIEVFLANFNKDKIIIGKGDVIAQICFIPFYKGHFIELEGE